MNGKGRKENAVLNEPDETSHAHAINSFDSVHQNNNNINSFSIVDLPGRLLREKL